VRHVIDDVAKLRDMVVRVPKQSGRRKLQPVRHDSIFLLASSIDKN